MSRNLRTYLNLLGQSVFYWTITYMLFITIRFYGIGEDEGLPLIDKTNIPFYVALQYAAFLGASIGVFYSLIEFVFDTYVSKRTALWFQILSKTFIYFIVLIICVSIIRKYYQYDNNLEIPVIKKGWWVKSKTFWVTVLFFVCSSLVFSILKMATEKLGPGVFLKMLLGKYKSPQEEKRIFMFLDLKNSTPIAEKLGHLKYSQFIQDCFYDLNELVPKYEAEIYQYVGDEAVLNWEYKKGLANNNCVSLFFDFQQKLQSKKDYYNQKYNEVPEFKAGLHGGTLMVAEVGTIKKELAYHGDVINTSARIQAECNTYNVPVLISENLLSDLNVKNPYLTKVLGDILLRGKKNKVNLYTISKA
ncbi:MULTISPECIES: adenylate/guanylate cyclase domain-containing protein [unclassified Tenacibaculum]|uniref:adenylate/guanylate cyclase domain-containing protein n=1 Tax=unclassified Tenacibaculum TaxID=2635139 RepID=UPI001F3A9A7F|nr:MULTISPECIES: adenylate/guanylate cyclase domain-containing protein [unclassified Tenacibaculum]MCF2873375.1 adenylate/guanylate cyclase domain-containing protein [Tenacibaculum sp. Cn5-1]MCF2933531.1 adenylate/guanylate cyclase domain-containing protein [Tenacibaculum sp. Cn5-34]MCG7509887.1 adenylate/guanylate cyclase domain-containing protein [Tenacibaculum sp. Cn5-46]